MRPTTPWSRHSRHHMMFTAPGAESGREHHPHDHPGRDRFEGPRGGRGHFPPGGGFGFGGGFGGPPGPPFGPGERGFGGPREERGRGRRGRHGRAGRGDVRSAILLLLAEEPMHGYQLMQAVADRTGGGWRPSPGAVYPTIAQLEDEGLVQVSAEGGRKLVTITDAGREHLTGLGDVDPFADFTGGGERVDLRGAIGELIGAVGQLSRVGDGAQLAAAATILADARRALYLILAGEGAAAADSAGTDAEQPPTT
jgi:DNA-binding PadR family transcriptional regulator